MLKRLTIAAAAAAFAITSAHAAAPWKKLMSPDELSAAMADGDVTIVDIRDPKAYATVHLPGAVNAPYPSWRGPADNPGELLDDAALTAVIQGAGLDPEDRVVITHAGTDQTDFGAAARVYWTLKSAGFPELAILNGGVRGWVAADKPLSVDPTTPTPSTGTYSLSDEWLADRDEIADIVSGKQDAALVDARPEAFFKGEKKHKVAVKAGTLKGAKDFPYASFFNGSDTEVVDETEARAILANAPVGSETVSFCNTGHWAATNWFAMSELAGKDNVKLYPESMVGWVKGGGETVTGK
ncbi:sulfurtransferase [Acuticoccus mangrovi]|uniref:Sulfurtransferase n=1 Tax=Acuticoccus mangrovi TaxID=2796142 RepID=A0A934IPD9_9HYPH|nr:rhodanese-like domain-containing protein [Acuticoccus mangrovi]MBJ3778606.1 sulfurtransferase [Acuticoccus mangrovi]